MLIKAKEVMHTASYGILKPGDKTEVTQVDGEGYVNAGLAEEVTKKAKKEDK